MNRIIVVPGANDATPPALAEEAVRTLRPAVVVGQFEVPQRVTCAGFRAARSIGATTILNPAPGAQIEPELLALSDWLVPNEHEFELIGGGRLDGDPAGEDARIAAFAARTGGSVAVTLGERGAALLVRGSLEVVRVPAPRVTAVDTTGAGDAFVGAFAVGLAVGLAPVDAARLGCASAADSVTRHGTQSSLADRAAAAALLASIRS
jgi:ribokinase